MIHAMTIERKRPRPLSLLAAVTDGSEFAALRHAANAVRPETPSARIAAHGEKPSPASSLKRALGSSSGESATGRELLVGDDPIVEETMDRRGGDADRFDGSS